MEASPETEIITTITTTSINKTQQRTTTSVTTTTNQITGERTCPRCGSNNTKFCYYNNYSISQPRHFCRSCRRYWTHGGVLRNIPVGGGGRKNKKRKILTSETNNSAYVNSGEPLTNLGYQTILPHPDGFPAPPQTMLRPIHSLIPHRQLHYAGNVMDPDEGNLIGPSTEMEVVCLGDGVWPFCYN